MSVDTKDRADTTIRVRKATRDIFADEAEARDTSMSSLLDELAANIKRERLYAQAREAARKDEENPEWLAEMDLWAEADLDGID
jgi:hypothetical protein